MTELNHSLSVNMILPIARAFDEVCLYAWRVFICVFCVCVFKCVYFFKCVLECISLPLRMCVSKILMRCQLDSSQLIMGCTLGVSVSLTHSHMLFPVLIFRLGRVMLASHSIYSLSLHCALSLSLSPSVLFRCGSLAFSFCAPKFCLMKHLSAIELFLLSSLSTSFMLLPCCSG